eukprot:1157112-Prymnesium_polylepis.1
MCIRDRVNGVRERARLVTSRVDALARAPDSLAREEERRRREQLELHVGEAVPLGPQPACERRVERE